MRGYDRAQVDAYVEENARWGAQSWGRITELENKVSELDSPEVSRRVREDADRAVEEARQTVDRFVQQVDARAAELDRAVAAAAKPQVDELRRQVEDLEDQRRTALARLAHQRESLEGLVRDLGIRVENGTREPNGEHPPDESCSPTAVVVPGDQ
jgi:polyhydroxyalkanoate synthesis regulator phasin